MFLPRNIVSGDFYWFKIIENKTVIVTADCTGHGVPGAFVSLLGISFLNEIFAENSALASDKIVNKLRDKIKISLKQKGAEGEQKDGMDISIYIINNTDLQMQYTGAQNPVYIVRKNPSTEFLKSIENNKKIRIYAPNNSDYSLIELKPDRMPVGIHLLENEFSRQDFQLLKNDLIYSFSDGYADQFGGEKNEKLMSQRFKNILLSLVEHKIDDQKKILHQEFESWKGYNSQLDDILVIGLKV